MIHKLRKMENFFVFLVISADILFIAAALLSKWPAWWQGIVPENSPMTWFESVLLFSCSLLALLIAFLSFLDQNKIRTWIWGLMTIAFLYFSLDERFTLHERIREGFLKPLNIKLPIFFWTGPGDFILLIFLILGLLSLPFLWQAVKDNRRVRLLFLCAVGVSGLAIVLDSFEIKTHTLFVQRLEQTIEEIMETTGMTLFLLAFFHRFTSDLYRLSDRNR